MDLAIHSSDDEETVALKEQLLLAKLKKKKLQAAQVAQSAAPAQTDDAVRSVARPVTPPPRAGSSSLAPSPSTPQRSGGRLAKPFASPIQMAPSVQVLSSPSPQKARQAPPVSPARVLLGIDKGLTGKDISLKRTPEKPRKSFNQRLAESKESRESIDRRHETVQRVRKERQSKFTTPQAFVNLEHASKDTSVDTVSGRKLHGRLIADADIKQCTSVASIVMGVRQFYAKAAPPDYDTAFDADDYVVWGIVGQKSDARDTQAQQSSKFCVLLLTDLKMDISVYLYDGAFERYWKLPVGSLVYLLNPGIQKPRPGTRTRVSLKVVDPDCVLEVGRATDFGICRSIKADGAQCTAWVDAAKQEVCDFHIDLALQKTVNKRMEFAGGTKPFDPRALARKNNATRGAGGQKRDSGALEEHRAFFGDKVTSFKHQKRDDTVAPGDAEARLHGERRLQREADARQREREMLAKLLANTKQSAGHDYFETTNPSASAVGAAAEERPAFSAQTLRKIGFDPAKRLFSSASSSSHRTGAAAQLDASAFTRNAGDVDLTIRRSEASLRFTKEGIEEARRMKALMDSTPETQAAKANDSSDDDLEITYS